MCIIQIHCSLVVINQIEKEKIASEFTFNLSLHRDRDSVCLENKKRDRASRLQKISVLCMFISLANQE